MKSHSADPKHMITYHGVEEEEEPNFPPLSPISQSLNSSSITLIILAVLEFETPIDESAMFDFLHNKFVPMSPRFSSIVETEKNGVQRWKKVDIRVEDHFIVPTFPNLGLPKSKEEYDVQLREYISRIGCESFPEGKPLWEVHLIKYPSLNGVRSLVFKLSHAIGDGYSYAKFLFFALNKAGHPSLPLSIPQISLRQQKGKSDSTPAGKLKRIRNNLGFIKECLFNLPQVLWTLVKAANKIDHPNLIRSDNTTKMELFRPVNISTMSFSFERIKQVKSILGATVNDVIMGMISYIIHLYMVKMGHSSSSIVDMNILVMINLRVLKGYKNMEEMIKAPDSWGNYSRFLPVPIPSFSSDSVKVNPLDFIIKAKETMSKKKNSLLIYMTNPMLNFWRSIMGQKGLEEVVYNSFSNASTMISSLIGPKEQMAIGDHPINSFYYLVTGVPQSLAFTSVSCMGELKLVATMEKGFIDSQVFSGCMNQAFEDIFEAALGKKYSTEEPGQMKTLDELMEGRR